jgi:valyl-tRNA synthetase
VFIGLSREEARKKVVASSRRHRALLEDQRPHRHSVGHSYRSHAAVEPYLSDQWYVKVTDDRLRGFAQRALVRDQRSSATHPPHEPTPGDGAMRFYPDRYAKTYESGTTTCATGASAASSGGGTASPCGAGPAPATRSARRCSRCSPR